MADNHPRNAFERARDAMLAYGISWWESVANAAEEAAPGATVSKPEIFIRGDPLAGFGEQILERRTITFPKQGRKKPRSWTITRAVPIRFRMLPPEELETIAREVLEQGEAEHRAVNLANVLEWAVSMDGEEGLDIARMCLGDDASEDELKAYAASLVPDALRKGGAAAEKFFDEAISVVSIDEDAEGGPQMLPEPAPAPGVHPIDTGEWDFYTLEEIDELSGPESDPAYAFRVVRLCEAMRANPERATHIAIMLGAITREWELWRENYEFLQAGRTRFAEQSRLARSKRKKPWMAQVRADFEAGKIGPSIAAYARKFSRQRNLNPPGVDTIQNFISKLRREQKAAAQTSQ
ncbi:MULTISPECIES: hypothetical protein [unclassified Sphingomonas]|uniref:hypothetical protein n=1 Tax=unclassified Sphingomonas TaxID=196159 RepID=UPI0009259817|nr:MULTISPECIES: hypothetical protein [unclassified Sphingomonas]MBN8848767.1 hypothetical protein [Sphingomonas sp.]OJV34358.1 MAG: hypothetical protein BGO24_11700 [Sphingomonas sp. 67-36]